MKSSSQPPNFDMYPLPHCTAVSQWISTQVPSAPFPLHHPLPTPTPGTRGGLSIEEVWKPLGLSALAVKGEYFTTSSPLLVVEIERQGSPSLSSVSD